MNREHWKQVLPVIQAFCEGKTIQHCGTGAWETFDGHVDEIIGFDSKPEDYRIKPEPKLRPWRSEEVPVGAVVRNKSTKARTVLVSALGSGSIFTGFSDEALCAKDLLECWELLDGSPCGVIE